MSPPLTAQRQQQQRRLPLELIFIVVEFALEKRPWQLQTLSLISKDVRKFLKRRLFQQLHMHSVKEWDSLIVKGWPEFGLPRRTLKVIKPDLSSKLSLYLHFLYRIDDEFSCYKELLNRLLHTQVDIRHQMETMGIRTMTSSMVHASLGLWTANLVQNLKRLYVDSSMLPPHGEVENADGTLSPFDSTQSKWHYDKVNVIPRWLSLTQPTNLEAYALTALSRVGIDGQFEGLLEQSQFIEKAFPRLKRLYLFHLELDLYDPYDIEDQVNEIFDDFDALTNVELMARIIVQDKESASNCPLEAKVCIEPRGTVILKTIVVDKPKGNPDMLGLMHRIIDDIDAEWAPEAFSGKRWPPSTRPRYTKAIPSRVAFEAAGGVIPARKSRVTEE